MTYNVFSGTLNPTHSLTPNILVSVLAKYQTDVMSTTCDSPTNAISD